MTNTISPSPVRFGADLQVENRKTRRIVTKQDAKNFNETVLPRFQELADKLEQAGVKAGDDLKMVVVSPRNYMNIVVKDADAKAEIGKKLAAARAIPVMKLHRNSRHFVYKNQLVKLQTVAEKEYEKGLPMTWFKKKWTQVKNYFSLVSSAEPAQPKADAKPENPAEAPKTSSSEKK